VLALLARHSRGCSDDVMAAGQSDDALNNLGLMGAFFTHLRVPCSAAAPPPLAPPLKGELNSDLSPLNPLPIVHKILVFPFTSFRLLHLCLSYIAKSRSESKL